MSKLQGKIKFYDSVKGFGFISQEDGQEIFVHVTGLIDDIYENDKVTFDVTDGKKGKNAINVEVVQ